MAMSQAAVQTPRFSQFTQPPVQSGVDAGQKIDAVVLVGYFIQQLREFFNVRRFVKKQTPLGAQNSQTLALPSFGGGVTRAAQQYLTRHFTVFNLH